MKTTVGDITTAKANGKISVYSPYDADFIRKAKNIGGKWANGAWNFPEESEQAVRELCREVFGAYPPDHGGEKTVHVRMDVSGLNLGQSLWAMGTQVVSRSGRDRPVSYGRGVALVSGRFPSSGGSRNYPSVGTPAEGTVLVVKNVPESLAREFAEDHDWAEVVEPEEPAEIQATLTMDEIKAMAQELAQAMATLSPEKRVEILHIVAAGVPDRK